VAQKSSAPVKKQQFRNMKRIPKNQARIWFLQKGYHQKEVGRTRDIDKQTG
jgi:hypothetical protein